MLDVSAEDAYSVIPHQLSIELEALQKRINYRFRDQQLLLRACTQPRYGGIHKPALDNKSLETEGDQLLAQAARAYEDFYFKDDPIARRRLHGFLVSNLFLSRAGMRLRLNHCVRANHDRVHAGNVEFHIRLTADVMEALIAAINRDGGTRALADFLLRTLFLDPRKSLWMRALIELHLGDREIAARAFRTLVCREYVLSVRMYSGFAVAIFRDGVGKPFKYTQKSRSLLHANLFVRLMRERPWMLWGFDGPAEPWAPHTSTPLGRF